MEITFFKIHVTNSEIKITILISNRLEETNLKSNLRFLKSNLRY